MDGMKRMRRGKLWLGLVVLEFGGFSDLESKYLPNHVFVFKTVSTTMLLAINIIKQGQRCYLTFLFAFLNILGLARLILSDKSTSWAKGEGWITSEGL